MKISKYTTQSGQEVVVYDYATDLKSLPKARPQPLQDGQNLSDYDIVYALRADKQPVFLLLPNEVETADAVNEVTANSGVQGEYTVRYVPKTFRNSDAFQALVTAASATKASAMQDPLFSESDDDEDEDAINAAAARIQRDKDENAVAHHASLAPQGVTNVLSAPPGGAYQIVPPQQIADDTTFVPNPYTSIPVAVGVAATGTTIGAGAVSGMIGSSLSASIASGLVLVPAAGALAAGILTNLALRAQYFMANGTRPTAEAVATINKTSWLAAGQLGGAFFGVEVARQGIERAIDLIAGNDWLSKNAGEFVGHAAGLGSVELKGAVMLVTGLGLGLGLMTAMIMQDVYHNRNVADDKYRKPYNPKAYATAFLVGFAIGAASSIGYGNEIASYLMPLATTTGLLMLMPVVEKPVVHAQWAGAKVSEVATTTSTLFATKWNQWTMKPTVVEPDNHIDNNDNNPNNAII